MGLEEDWTARLGDVGDGVKAGAGIGAAFGSVMPGIGTAIGGGVGAAVGGLVGLARNLTNQPHGEEEAPALAEAARAITGEADPARQVAVLQADPVANERFRLDALAVRARAEKDRDAHILAVFRADAADRAGARAADAGRTGALKYASLGVTLLVFGLYGGVLVGQMYGLPSPLPDDMATLRNLALAASFFWLGSNFSSWRKTDILAAERERR